MADFFAPRAKLGGGGGKAGKSAAARPEKLVPWVEKYRPKRMDDVAYQDEVVRALKASIISGNLPHLLFYGPPGTGKTSTILAIAKELFGPEMYRSRVLELNASDERGIKVIREKVKAFASVQASEGQQQVSKDGVTYPCPPYKIIVLDEADSMTVDAQSALRRTMEDHSRSTRFCIICNYISRIIEPIASRCAKFRFRSLELTTMRDRLRKICDEEKLEVQDEILDETARLAEGDMRKAITFLQSASRMSVDRKSISLNDVFLVTGALPSDVVELLISACASGDFDKAQEAVTRVTSAGYSASQILSQMADALVGIESKSKFKSAPSSSSAATTTTTTDKMDLDEKNADEEDEATKKDSSKKSEAAAESSSSSNNNNNSEKNSNKISAAQLCMKLSEPARGRLALKFSAVDKAINDGADEWLQLTALCGAFVNEFQQANQQAM